ncbi:AAA family ATPase [Streptosporangiaceae bacterium NEAU-GS5]|nr:AAA family ATPase [Streptosporangiaceae bacterium NEAU-GS5]
MATVVVMGLMGAGKSSVARLVAGALGRPMRDSDEDLQARYGKTAAQINADEGADELHAREAQVLFDALNEGDVVVAAAASTVEDPVVRAALEPAYVVYLDAPPEVLAERMKSGAHRPHFQPDLVRMLTEQRTRRLPYFTQVADLVVDSSKRTPEETAREVAERLP